MGNVDLLIQIKSKPVSQKSQKADSARADGPGILTFSADSQCPLFQHRHTFNLRAAAAAAFAAAIFRLEVL